MTRVFNTNLTTTKNLKKAIQQEAFSVSSEKSANFNSGCVLPQGG
jgi:hypothetical protein